MLKQGVTAGRIFPVTCGVATTQPRHRPAAGGAGRGPALAGDARRRRGEREGGEAIEIEPDEDGPLVAYVFKTLADPYTGRVNLFRVYRGTLRSDSQVVNVTRRQKERIGQLGQPLGKDLEPVAELGAGDIGAVAKLKETRAGDVLCERRRRSPSRPSTCPRR